LAVYGDFDESSIVVIDVSSSPPSVLFTISGTGTHPVVRPRIQGDYIVYERSNGIDFDIWVKEVSGLGGDWLMTLDPEGDPAPGNQQDPAVSGNKMVYCEDNSRVWLCDITYPPNCTLIDEGQDPDIDGNRVVYSKLGEFGNYDVFLYTIGGPDLPINLTKRAGDQRFPAIIGNYVVYQDDSAGNWDIYLYLINEKLTFRVTSDPSDQRLPDIDYGHIVYEDNRNGTSDIYVTDFSITTPQAACEQLESALKRCDDEKDDDFVVGKDREALYDMIENLMSSIGCD